jgi:hypothetical protein
MLINRIDIAYLAALQDRHDEGVLEINTRCPECDSEMPEGYLTLLEFADQHMVIDLRPERGIECVPTLVIGCEGYHIMVAETGKIKDHDDQ